jgi:thioester reductase-like protein
VTSNHLAPYKKEDIKYGGVRAVNVIGVQRMLEFASTKRTKWVYHASTFLALWGKTGVTYDRCPETWPNGYVDELDNFPNFGYAISKIIADDLIHQATQRGIPGYVKQNRNLCVHFP